MKISDEAVAAAAKAIHAMWMAPDGVSWDDDPDAQEAYTSEAQVALEAAAPHLMASAVAYLDESVRMISSDPEVKDYERGFDDAIRGMAAKVKRLLNGEAQ